MSGSYSIAEVIAQANVQQGLASDPAASVFVSASAGSGKTKLLIDRLLRLMLPRELETGEIVPGSPPARILCLTFTRAAAAEMAIRLQHRLGQWVTYSDEALNKDLAALFVPCTQQTRQQARALFAEVLDLPGGMRIGTIHAFCQSLLRSFPLEAAMNPYFTVLEETDAALALNGCVETVLSGQNTALLAPLAGIMRATDFVGLAASLRRDEKSKNLFQWVSKNPDGIRSVFARVLRLPPEAVQGSDTDQLEKACTGFAGEENLRSFLGVLSEEGTEAVRRNTVQLLDWLSLSARQRAEQWDVWRNGFLTRQNKPRSTGLITKKLSEKYPQQAEYLLREAERILAVDDVMLGRELVSLGAALVQMVAPVSALYTERKTRRGLVEYEDLIHNTLQLLREPGAAWVMYKLDGGIDHLLLDEVQDTSAEQWRIAGDLTEEFFAGQGAREEEAGPRTVFAVGDYKQSIYGFQGADPESFRTWRERFQQRAEGAGQTWYDPALTVSFRSTLPVLKLVDAVFSVPEAARGVVDEGAPPMQHLSARVGQPGRVELWPLTESVREDEDEVTTPWDKVDRNTTRQNARQKLADTLARHIAHELASPPAPGEEPLTPGDILILVPRRSPFVTALIRALKIQNIPVMTLVSTGLADQLAVQDLVALCSALLLPQDDLTLACVLTSPLGGVSDDSLMALATGRKPGEPLWSALRERHAQRPDWSRAWALLDSLFHRVDYLTPHELLSEALGRGGGRARLLARLGPEAAEAIDELLSAALRYQEMHPPSLQGFVFWIQNSQESVKRIAEAGSQSVRVMTAHGAKGLQARLVILPDTVSKPRYEERVLWSKDKQIGVDVPLYVPRSALSTTVTRSLRARAQAKAIEEYNRLLYVALTRAAERLIVCGWMPAHSVPAESWYERCRQGFEAAGAISLPYESGDQGGEMLVIEENSAKGQEDSSAVVSVPPSLPHKAEAPVLPGWMGSAPDWKPVLPEAESALSRPLAPSRPDDVMLGPLPATTSPLDITGITPAQAREAAFARGRLVHSLLQYLPEHPQEQWMALAMKWLKRPVAAGGQPDEADTLARQVIEVLSMPELAPLFSGQARVEQRLAGVAGGQVIVGQVDRMCVLPDRVLLCDFKSGRHVPRSVSVVPVLYLRQMAAYRLLLQGLYPDRPVTCVLVWTEGPRADVLPDELLDENIIYK